MYKYAEHVEKNLGVFFEASWRVSYSCKKWGCLLNTHTDSTTGKVVGKFAPAGIHINRDEYLSLPTMPISSETRNNTAEEIYSKIGVHMTDSTSDNKEIAKSLGETFHRKEIAGQIFCDSRATLGFDKGIAKTIHMIENKMGM